MVILIGGVSCSGKTLMAQRLLERYNIPYLSIDHIKMGLIRGGRYCDFTAEDSDEELTEKLWPIVKGIVVTNIENGQHIIIEGCYLPPENIRDFEPEYLDQIVSFYIGFSSNYIEKHYESGILDHCSEIEQREMDPYLGKEHLTELHARLIERCRTSGAKLFEIQEDYNRELEEAYRWIENYIVKH